jgi:hypothetical protein
MTGSVFPVGHYMGQRHPEGDHVVRVGLAHETLTEDEFGVWVLSHGTAEIGRGTWTVADVLRLADGTGLTGTEAAVDRLTSVGALVQVEDPVRFAETHRLFPLLVGLGNTEDEPSRYAVGLPGLPPVAVLDEPSHELWQWASLSPSLWHSCEVLAKVAGDLGTPTTPGSVLESALGDVRVLLVNSVAYLDLV